MKLQLSLIVSTLLTSSVFSFTPATSNVRTFGMTKVAKLPTTSSTLFEGPEEEEEGGLDLNLEEMFTMFDAADKEEDFDKAIEKVKTDEKKK
mmetsp:Transcript_8230/g.10451  ORF Transcript_8230/g.10451 Transcript_8230/m.10451 type:complete len:92 (+) Transcript_8230:153-428(+)